MVDLVGKVVMGVFAFTFAAIIAGLILHKLIGMYLLNELSPTISVVVIGIYVWLIISLVTLKIVLAIGLLIPLAVILALPVVSNRRSDRRMDEEKMEQYRAAIESDPGNLAARTQLATTLHRVGDLDQAIEQLAEVVRRMPSSIEDAHRLRKYVDEREERALSSLLCPACRKPNPMGRTRCYSCESPLSLSASMATWLQTTAKWQIAAISLVTVAGAAVVMTSLTALPSSARVFVVIIMLSTAVGIGIYRVSRMR